MIPEEATLNECPYFSPEVYYQYEDTKTINKNILDNRQMKVIAITVIILILVYWLCTHKKW